MPIQVKSSILQFAGDLKMFRVVHDAQELQDNINKLTAWANKWQLIFNISKCYLLHLGLPDGYGEYNIQGTQISSNDTIKDLGVLIDDNLKFHAYTTVRTSVIAKANQTLAIINKSFHFTDNTFVTLYKSLVRPVVE